MKIFRTFIFIIFVWILATIPWLATRAFCSEDWVKYSLIFGSANTAGVIIFLFFWGLLRKRSKILPIGLSLMFIYLTFAIAVLIWGFIGQAKEPLIWEGAVPLIIMLCPISMVVIITHFFSFPFDLILAICSGGIFYFLLGKIYEKFVLQKNII